MRNYFDSGAENFAARYPTAAVTAAAGTATTITGGVSHTRGSGKFRYTCPDVSTGSWNSSFYVPGGNAAPDLAAMMHVDFYTDARYVELYTLQYNTSLDIRVDGKLVSHQALSSSGAGYLIKIDFGAGTDGIRKHIEYAGFNFPFGGVFTEATASCWYPTVDQRPLLYCFGDSYTQGVGADGPDQVYARAMADNLGMRVYQDGIGGKGWNSTDSAAVTTRAASRLAKMKEAPAIIASCFGYNDAGGDMALLKSNFNAWYSAVKSLFPKTQVVVFGAWSPLGATANLDLVDAALQEVAGAKGLTFIKVSGLVNANNKGKYTSGDNVHPTQLGHTFLGYRMAELLSLRLTK